MGCSASLTASPAGRNDEAKVVAKVAATGKDQQQVNAPAPNGEADKGDTIPAKHDSSGPPADEDKKPAESEKAKGDGDVLKPSDGHNEAQSGKEADGQTEKAQNESADAQEKDVASAPAEQQGAAEGAPELKAAKEADAQVAEAKETSEGKEAGTHEGPDDEGGEEAAKAEGEHDADTADPEIHAAQDAGAAEDQPADEAGDE